MKAYEVSFNGWLDLDDGGNVDIVFAKNVAKAKKAVANGETVFNDSFNNAKENGASYTDIRVVRVPELDNCENLSNMEMAEKLIMKCGWYWGLNGKQYDKDNFAKQEFEKAWKDTYKELA